MNETLYIITLIISIAYILYLMYLLRRKEIAKKILIETVVVLQELNDVTVSKLKIKEQDKKIIDRNNEKIKHLLEKLELE